MQGTRLLNINPPLCPVVERDSNPTGPSTFPECRPCLLGRLLGKGTIGNRYRGSMPCSIGGMCCRTVVAGTCVSMAGSANRAIITTAQAAACILSRTKGVRTAGHLPIHKQVKQGTLGISTPHTKERASAYSADSPSPPAHFPLGPGQADTHGAG